MTSVIVPCWNGLALTRVCVQRLLELTGEPFELVLVDNGSTDGTGRWLSRLRRLSNVKVIRNRANLGYAAAMNQGIASSRGKLLVFGNSDAAVSAGWLAQMKTALAQGGAAAVAPCANPPSRDRLRMPWRALPWYRDLAGLDRLSAAASLLSGPAFMPARGFIPGFWVLTRRAVVRQVGGFDAGLGLAGTEDLDWQWRVHLSGGRLGFARKAYVHHVWSASILLSGSTPRKAFKPLERRFLRSHPGSERWDIDACALGRPDGRA